MTLDRKRLLGWGRDALLLVAALVGLHLFATRHVAKGPAPQLEGVALDGRSVDLRGLRGKPVLVHFWATWCPVCRQEEGAIAAIAADHPVVTVATESGAAPQIASYLAQRGVKLPALPDPEGRLAGLYGVDRFPTSFILDGEGRIRFVEVGYTTSLGLRLRLWLASL